MRQTAGSIQILLGISVKIENAKIRKLGWLAMVWGLPAKKAEYVPCTALFKPLLTEFSTAPGNRRQKWLSRTSSSYGDPLVVVRS